MDESLNPTRRCPAGKRELVFALAMVLGNIFLWNCILFAGFNLGFALGAAAVMGCSVWYLGVGGCRFGGYSRALLALSAGLAAGFARSDDAFVKGVCLLFLLVGVNLALCLAAGQNRRGPDGVASVLDAPRAVLMLGVGNLLPAARGLNDARREAEAAGKKGGAALVGLVIALPVAAVLVVLLMRADAAFEGLMDLLPAVNWAQPVWSAVFGLLGGWLLYARGVGLRGEKGQSAQRRFRGVSSVTVNTLLLAVGAVYCAYLLSQLAYLGGGFAGILPEEYTLAQYARRGFFEMAWLSAINLGIICLAVGLVAKDAAAPRATRGMCLFLGAVTLFLIATASAKMALYIRGYGLTRLRVLTQVIMVWLAVATVLVGVWLVKPRFGYMPAVILTALVLGAAVLWADVDTQVARFNVRAYQAGQLETIDVYHLGGLGSGAVPYLAELREDDDPEVAEAARELLAGRGCYTLDFRDWNYSKAVAEKFLR